MKKLLVSLLLVLAVTLSAEAQHNRKPHPRRFARRPHREAPAPRPRYHDRGMTYYYNPIGEVRLHVGGELGFTDIGGLFMHEIPYHYGIGAMAEVQTGRLLSLGLGADYYGSRNLGRGNYQNDTYLNCVPIYANIRLSTPGHCTRLFVEGKAGYAIPLNSVELTHPYRGEVVAQGFYTGVGVGLDFYNNNISIGFNSIDLHYVDKNHLHNGSTADGMFTDFYIKYSYAFPLN